MKVYISNYRDHWLSPYTIIEKVLFWRKKDILLFSWEEKVVRVLTPICSGVKWVLDKIHPRVEYVKLDYWDTWAMDSTLAIIITPMLKQLKATQHGHPIGLTEKQWHKIMDKMIWSFECLSSDSGFHGFKFEGDYTRITSRRYHKHMEKVQEGLDLFGKYYMNLWD